MLSFRYQYISLSSLAFSDRIVAMGVEFTLILEMEVKLICNPSSFIIFD